jgi:hypothetical protein
VSGSTKLLVAAFLLLLSSLVFRSVGFGTYASELPAHEHLLLCRAVFGDDWSFSFSDRLFHAANDAKREAGIRGETVVCWGPEKYGEGVRVAQIQKNDRAYFIVGTTKENAGKLTDQELKVAIMRSATGTK